ncbi:MULTISPECIES: hypothetical protein [Streptomyces]|uniref:Uncharacterized protein n=2 Tax=Streptomyces rimosus subsp. rimosus TaxID=132474 RepID=L8EKP2_STRR1|nr:MULTISPECIES: hypothetical protein [Streptomyces]KOG72796.1 hypothetical protein ADK78_18640 [Kitasatospora aureofaciens]MYT44674.1 hypothetical protein [Streptomyces sp. SID5471]KEF04550.1 hypothetical protein DF17_23640 [Streptomyces rimosus]KUJ32547.1 hypothetical protein ADK46_22625 [Streptomyces rimosus subsp. rimosus]QDA06473.1 hypothetical protein CTZ40_24605 [Streptomyces rimosus]
MKYAKTAAFLAGSAMALGAASPVFAGPPRQGPSFSINGGIAEALKNKQLDGRQLDPVVRTVEETSSDLQDSPATRKLVHAVGDVAQKTPGLKGVEVARGSGK